MTVSGELARARRALSVLAARVSGRRRLVIVVGASAAAFAVIMVLALASGPGADPEAGPAVPGEPISGTDARPVASPSPTSRSTVPRSTTASPTTAVAVSTSVDAAVAPTTPTTVAVPPAVDPESPAVVARPIPTAPSEAIPPAPSPPWAWSIRTTPAGYVTTDVGCATGTGAAALDAFFAERIGPLMGTDYQHVYPLGDGRSLWLFQDAFLDHSGAAERLGQARFAHNVGLVQDGACFTLFHRGTTAVPASFESGGGERPLSRWFWPLGGEASNGRLQVFWVEMIKDGYEPGPGDGLGWHPGATWIGTYDTATLARQSFVPAPNPGVAPIYGYAVSSDSSYTYLFGNSFEQNLAREGGFWAGPHSGTSMWLARVPIGQLDAAPEYRTDVGWSVDPVDAQPFLRRYWTENPMQPRYIGGQWVSTTKVDGYWGEELSVDVALDPWGPWTTVERRVLTPRGADPAMNTYHAHLLPWQENGSLVVVVSQNARDMVRDAYPHPWRYRPTVFTARWVPAPPPAPPPPPPPPPDTTVDTPADTTPVTPPSETTPPETTPTTAPTTTAPTTTAPTSTTAPTTTAPTTTATSTTSAPTTTTTAVTTATTSRTPPTAIAAAPTSP